MAQRVLYARETAARPGAHFIDCALAALGDGVGIAVLYNPNMGLRSHVLTSILTLELLSFGAHSPYEFNANAHSSHHRSGLLDAPHCGLVPGHGRLVLCEWSALRACTVAN